MISDTTALFNLALNAIGGRSNIASPTEKSREASVCSLWYEVVRDQVFAAAPWPELTKIAALTVVDEYDGVSNWVSTNARPGYLFAYQMPTDSARPQYLTNFDRFLITSYTDSTQVLATNTENAILAYTAKNLNIQLWSPTLQLAMTYALASHIVMPLSGKVTRAKQMVDQANSIIAQAREVAANTSSEQFEMLPDWISARGYRPVRCNLNSLGNDRFIYPLGDMLMVSPGVN